MKIINPCLLLITICLLLVPGYALFAQPSQPDYTSKVPQYTFPNTLTEQEAALKTNPLMLRLVESRKKLSGDRFRPIFHYVNPEGTLNDPNGLCYWQGNWHLFYQAYPPEDTRQHWGHAISKDLIHWRDLPYAIYPAPEKMVFSGSSLVEDDRVIAIYHGTAVGNMVATSSDPLLLNWTKVTGNAVIPAKSNTGFPKPYSVFDPSIWKKDGIYYSLSAGRTETGPGGRPVRADYLFRSKDLATWEYMHEFVEDDRFTLVGDDGACPYFWPIGDRYIMNFFSHMSGGQYLLGDYDKVNDKFMATAGGKYNMGAVGPAGVHAPSATPDGKGGVVIIFNMNQGRPTEGWNHIMSLPRRLTLLEPNVLGQQPIDEIAALRYNGQQVNTTALPSNKEIVFKKIKGNAMELEAEIDAGTAQMIVLNVLQSPGREEYTSIELYREKGFGNGLSYQHGAETALMPADLIPLVTGEKAPPRKPNVAASLISINSSHSSNLPDAKFRAPETAAFMLQPGEKIKLRVFVDKSIVEVFVNNKQCVAMRVYPGRNDSVGVSMQALGGNATLTSLNAWQMKNIYEE